MTTSELRNLGPEICESLRGRFPELSSAVRLKTRRLRTYGSHLVTVVETDTHPVRRFLLKGPICDRLSPDMRAERFATESRLLTEVAPRIQAENPRARCPEVLAADPRRQILVLEFVEGGTLKSRLLGGAGPGGSDAARDLLRLCGEWLARFHTLTRSGENGNPFEWIVAKLAGTWARWVFEHYVGSDTYRELCRLAEQAGRHHADFRQSRCWVHGVFGSHHVLERDGQIYVIDLESSHPGYAHEDLGFFSVCPELFLPWRRGLGARRVDPAEQARLVVEAYHEHALPPTAPEAVLLRFARLLALARFLGSSVSGNYLVGPQGRLPPLKAPLLVLWWRRQIAAISRRELVALREVSREWRPVPRRA
jgi:Ser/Thr protein kinase RdoA (MazF antagonist)